MSRVTLAAVVSACVCAVPTVCDATSHTAPAFAFGLQGSYTEQEFTGHGKTDTEHMPEGGAFINFGNKMTSTDGFIYQAELSGLYSKHQNQKVKDAQADLDLGWRIALAERHSVDLLVGGGYKWNRLQPNNRKYDIDLTNRTPFAKVALGYNYRFDTATLRFEAGMRKLINGDSQLEIHGISNEKVDLKDGTHPFAEMSLLFNQDGMIPVIASLYYSRFEYELDGQFVMTPTDTQVRDEYGIKLGVSF